MTLRDFASKFEYRICIRNSNIDKIIEAEDWCYKNVGNRIWPSLTTESSFIKDKGWARYMYMETDSDTMHYFLFKDRNHFVEFSFIFG